MCGELERLLGSCEGIGLMESADIGERMDAEDGLMVTVLVVVPVVMLVEVVRFGCWPRRRFMVGGLIILDAGAVSKRIFPEIAGLPMQIFWDYNA